jgi:hypothetical protein
MATAKSDDESDVASHPLAENRPGVYVQVVAPRRRKKGKRGDSASSSRPPAGDEGRAPARGKARVAAREETDARVSAREGSDPRAESDTGSEQNTKGKTVANQAPAAAERLEATGPAPTSSAAQAPAEWSAAGSSSRADPNASTLAAEPASTPAPGASTGASEIDDEDDGRQSGERAVDFDSRFGPHAEARPSMRTRETESENTNDRPDLLGVSIPPPPRLPSFSSSIKPEREIATDPPAHSASLLDAPHSLRPGAEFTPAARPSNTLLAFVGVCSAIIVMAGLVALRDVTKSEPAASSAPQASNSAPLSPASHGAAPAPRTTVEAFVPSALPAPPTPTADPSPEATSAHPALPLPAAASAVQQGSAAAKATARMPALRQTAKPAAAKALLAKANAALSNLKNTGAQATPGAESEEPPAAEGEDRVPGADEPLELPVNPY